MFSSFKPFLAFLCFWDVLLKLIHCLWSHCLEDRNKKAVRTYSRREPSSWCPCFSDILLFPVATYINQMYQTAAILFLFRDENGSFVSCSWCLNPMNVSRATCSSLPMKVSRRTRHLQAWLNHRITSYDYFLFSIYVFHLVTIHFWSH